MSQPNSPSLPARLFRIAPRAWWLVFAAYILLYAVLLWRTDGYPYGLDNNESYSSWWHARSLAENGLSATKGLTDEVFAHHPEASPYIHSHQGNFPRLFTWVCYALGFRDIASHIWITTFTVGLASFWLAYLFLARLVSPRFAVVACLVMMSNYLLFAQWQVSLYNIWHTFFFFSSLRCIQVLGEVRRWRWWVGLTLLNFAALFYWEYVFTAFMTVLCAIYAIALYWRRWRLVLLAAGLVAGGAALAAGLLLAQLTAYMGWANVMEDVRLTLTARNAAEDPELLARVTGFYAEHRIIFWHNFKDAAPLRTTTAFWAALRDHHFAHYPVALLPAIFLLPLGALLSGLTRGQIPRPQSLGALLLCLVATAWILRPVLFPALPLPVLAAVVLALAVPAALLALRHEQLGRAAVGALLAYALAGGIILDWLALQLSLPTLVDDALPAADFLLWLATVGAAAAGALAVVGPRLPGGARLALILAAGTVAYAFTYVIFTGYVFSGYLYRLVPMLVYITDLLVAAAVVVVAGLATASWRARAYGGLLVALIAAFSLPVLWIAGQTAALRLVPPDSFAFLRLLEREPFHGRSLVSNTYPAPMAARTGSWGYADTALFTGQLRLGAEGWEVDRDLKYLWFADRDNNADYLHPALALHLVHPTNPNEARNLVAREALGERSLPGLVRRAREPFQPFLQHTLLHDDDRRLAIIGMDWEFPPFLRPQTAELARLAADSTLRERLAVSAAANSTRSRWRITWEWLGPPSAATPIWHLDGAPLAHPADPAGTALLLAERLELHLPAPPPTASRLRLIVNDTTAELDLADPAVAGRVFTWTAAAPFGTFTRVPITAPGVHVATHLTAADLAVSYRFAHQLDTPEHGTRLHVYAQADDTTWALLTTYRVLGPDLPLADENAFLAANPDALAEHAASVARGDPRDLWTWLAAHLPAHPVEIARPGLAGRFALAADGLSLARLPTPPAGNSRIQISVTPATTRKIGPEYYSLPILVGADDASPDSLAAGLSDLDQSAPLPYGELRVRLRLPLRPLSGSEPLVVTGRNEAADLLYIVYHDERHIRIGLDHWFRGGPLSAPIPVNYDAEHLVEISLGSLYPPATDFAFALTPPAAVEALKNRVTVRWNGVTVYDITADAYESSPAEVKVGRNDVSGTSCGLIFSGEILAVERVWPEDM